MLAGLSASFGVILCVVDVPHYVFTTSTMTAVHFGGGARITCSSLDIPPASPDTHSLSPTRVTLPLAAYDDGAKFTAVPDEPTVAPFVDPDEQTAPTEQSELMQELLKGVLKLRDLRSRRGRKPEELSDEVRTQPRPHHHAHNIPHTPRAHSHNACPPPPYARQCTVP